MKIINPGTRRIDITPVARAARAYGLQRLRPSKIRKRAIRKKSSKNPSPVILQQYADTFETVLRFHGNGKSPSIQEGIAIGAEIALNCARLSYDFRILLLNRLKLVSRYWGFTVVLDRKG